MLILYFIIEKGGKQLIEVFEQKHKSINSIVDNLVVPKNLRKWQSKTTNGAFYFNESLNGIVSNSFAIDLERDTVIYLTIEPYTTNLHESKNSNFSSILKIQDIPKTQMDFVENFFMRE